MARIIEFTHASLSGKAGGLIYSRNKAGYYTRNAVAVVKPNSDRQMSIKTRMTAVSQAWQGVDADEKQAWGTYAKNVTVQDRFGGRGTISGAAMFVRTNMSRKEAGLSTILEIAPRIFYLGEKDPTVAAAISEDTQNISLTFDNTLEWANEVGGKMLVYMGTPQNASREFFNGPFALAGVISGATPTAPASPATIAVPKTVAQGQKVWLQIRILRADGRLSDPFRCNCVVGS